MSDGISDSYREERAWDAKVKKFREQLSEQDVEMIYYKARELHDLAHDLWSGYGQDISIRHMMFKPGVDLKALFSEYLKKLKKVMSLPDTMPEGGKLYWYSDKPYFQKKEKSKKDKR